MEIPAGLDGLGVVGVVLLMGLLVVRGLLVPRRTYDDKVREAEEWRKESRTKDAQIAEKDAQLRHMEEVGRSVNAVMRALQQGTSTDHRVGE